MPSGGDTSSIGPRREQRARRRRRWQSSLILGAVVALLVGGTAFAVTGPLQHDDHGRTTRPGAAGAPATWSTAEKSCRAPLHPDDPLRLWIGGDSLAGSLGPALGELTGKSGVVQPVLDSRVSSGLLSRDFVNWPKLGGEDMTLYNPEVVVFIIGANDAKNIPEAAPRDPRWRAQYSELVEEMLTILGANGRTVYWIGAPVMADAKHSARVQGVNDVFQEVVAKHPEVTYIDAYSLFSSPGGTFAATLPVPGGGVARVRAADGIHFTPEGGDLIAGSLFERLDPACRITEQAVRGEVKPTIEAKGSSSVPGSRRGMSTATTRGAGTGG